MWHITPLCVFEMSVYYYYYYLASASHYAGLINIPAISGLQEMINICSNFSVRQRHDIVFNPKKTVSMVVGNSVYCSPELSLHMNGSPIAWVSRLKYLGIYFVNKKGLCVDVSEVKRKFYASCNNVLCQSKHTCETVQVMLTKSYCLPLLSPPSERSEWRR